MFITVKQRVFVPHRYINTQTGEVLLACGTAACACLWGWTCPTLATCRRNGSSGEPPSALSLSPSINQTSVLSRVAPITDVDPQGRAAATAAQLGSAARSSASSDSSNRVRARPHGWQDCRRVLKNPWSLNLLLTCVVPRCDFTRLPRRLQRQSFSVAVCALDDRCRASSGVAAWQRA